jgi:hypothetical protein
LDAGLGRGEVTGIDTDTLFRSNDDAAGFRLL